MMKRHKVLIAGDGPNLPVPVNDQTVDRAAVGMVNEQASAGAPEFTTSRLTQPRVGRQVSTVEQADCARSWTGASKDGSYPP